MKNCPSVVVFSIVLLFVLASSEARKKPCITTTARPTTSTEPTVPTTSTEPTVPTTSTEPTVSTTSTTAKPTIPTPPCVGPGCHHDDATYQQPIASYEMHGVDDENDEECIPEPPDQDSIDEVHTQLIIAGAAMGAVCFVLICTSIQLTLTIIETKRLAVIVSSLRSTTENVTYPPNSHRPPHGNNPMSWIPA